MHHATKAFADYEMKELERESATMEIVTFLKKKNQKKSAAEN